MSEDSPKYADDGRMKRALDRLDPDTEHERRKSAAAAARRSPEDRLLALEEGLEELRNVIEEMKDAKN